MEIINIINEFFIQNYVILTYRKETKIKKIYINDNSNFKYKYIFLLIIIISFIYICSYNYKYNIINYKAFIKDCDNVNINKLKHKFNNYTPYLSICIPVFNMENYIGKSIMSIINQSFNNYEIIIVNDNSNDNTEKIINIIQLFDKRIKLIKHRKNLGVYYSRKEAAFNTNGKYILFMDPDDMFLNPYLFEELYNYNRNYNLDMIEFSVYHKEELKKKIYFPIYHEFNHYHNYKKNIIYQPELSDIIFYIPNTKIYTAIMCRTIWNKIVRKKILIHSFEYINKYFNNCYLITADDTPINILNYQYANNYSNIKLPGYLYNIRKNSMSRTDNEIKHDIIVSYNYLLYFKLLYKYIKDFNKDLNYLYHDLKANYIYILKFRELNATNYIYLSIYFFKEIINDNISLEFKTFVNQLQNNLF